MGGNRIATNHRVTARLLSLNMLFYFGTEDLINKADYRVKFDCCDHYAGGQIGQSTSDEIQFYPVLNGIF